MMLALLLSCAPSVAPPTDAPVAAVAVAEAPLPPHTVFPSAGEALKDILAGNPSVIGVGEVHASTDRPGIPSTISRFTEELLPILAPRTTDLVIETWRMESACGAPAEQVVSQVEVETKRPEETKDEIVVLAEKAAALGVRPHDLPVSCAEYPTLLDEQGEVAYDRLLRLLTLKLGAFADAGLDTADASMVLYGGAMHNDVSPGEDLRDYSYGVEARARGGARYVELDLYQPELLVGRETLLEEAWTPLLERAVGPDHAVLYERAPGSYVLFLPTRVPPATEAVSPGTPP